MASAAAAAVMTMARKAAHVVALQQLLLQYHLSPCLQLAADTTGD
jgi:hypothetical protein